MGKHRAGPWFSKNGEIVDSAGDDIFHLCDDATYDANNKLMAAAPDLLQACEELVMAMVQLGKEHHREVAQARAAIAKATDTPPATKARVAQ